MIQIESIQKYVEDHMSEKRFRHTLGVVETAQDLAIIHGEDINKAAIAALLHDAAKELSSNEMRRFCTQYNIYIDEYLDEHIKLTHGMIAAHIARQRFHIEDQDVLNAIENHTLGRKNMSTLEKIIYLADAIEPYRIRYSGLQKLREVAYEDLDKAMELALSATINHVQSKNERVHPIVYEILKEYTHC